MGGKRRQKGEKQSEYEIALKIAKQAIASKDDYGNGANGDDNKKKPVYMTEEKDSAFQAARIKLKGQIKPGPGRDMEYVNESEDHARTTEEFEEQLPFCCNFCCCDKNEPGYKHKIQPSVDLLWHRACCHRHTRHRKASKENRIWVCPTIEAMEKAAKLLEKAESFVYPNSLQWIDPNVMKEAYETAKRQEAEIYNKDGEECPDSGAFMNERYIEEIYKPFEKLITERENGPKPCMVVLDCFAGVGTAILALKHIGIDIAKVVHVEHDKIATHVYRSNHDSKYNESLQDDGVEHIYEYKCFEDIQENLQEICGKHGPFDLIIGGPPCSDFSLVNAYREGVTGQQGHYMIDFGRMIRKMESLQPGHPLFFIAENVFLTEENLREVKRAFGFNHSDCDPLCFDARDISPIRRKRHFLMNIPMMFNKFRFQYDGPESHTTPSSCLENGFKVPGEIVEPQMIAKAQCLMASKSKIDDFDSLRMFVFKDTPNEDGHFYGRPMELAERENLMGYPPGYIEKPVSDLFKVLYRDALTHLSVPTPETKNGEMYRPWKETLAKKYHHFKGNYHCLPVKDPYRFKVIPGDVKVEMAPPIGRDNGSPSFFDDEQYAKHLIGNAFSVPVIELLLKPLTLIFRNRSNEGFNYQFEWLKQHQNVELKNPQHKVQNDSLQIYASKHNEGEECHTSSEHASNFIWEAEI